MKQRLFYSTERTVHCELPWPPSVNRYYRHVDSRVLISKQGRIYRASVAVIIGAVLPLNGGLHIVIHAYPPDKRRRDIDNILKALLDALEHAGVYIDDYQISKITIERGKPRKGGVVVIDITEAG